MFSVGELMIYGTNGVCRVKDICASPFDPSDERQYYVLMPLNDNSNLVIYTPVGNESVVMRPLLSPDCARGLINSIPELDTIEVPIEKRRRDVYRAAMQTADPVEYVKLIKTVRTRRAEFVRTRRRLPDLDNDFEHAAKNCLYGELSEVLGIRRDEVNTFIADTLGEAAGT